MFPFGTYGKNQLSAANDDVVYDTTAIETLEKEESHGLSQNCSMQEFSSTTSDTANNTLVSMPEFSSTTGDTVNNTSVNLELDADIETLMAEVNDGLERELKDTKKAVKRIFKEMVAFHGVARKIHAQWAPIRDAEYQEALRLDELQADVEGTIGALPGVRLDIPPPPTKSELPSSS